MLSVTAMSGFGASAAASKPITATLVVENDVETTPDNNSVHTHSSLALGTSTADRVLVLLINVGGWLAGYTGVTATVGGVATTVLKNQASIGAGTEQGVSIHSYALGAGITSGDVILTVAGTNWDDSSVTIFDMKNGNAAATATGGDSDAATGNAVTTALTIPAGGACFAIKRSSAGITTTWSSDGGMAEVFDEGMSTNFETSVATSFPTAEQSSVTISATPSSSGSINLMAAVAFEPA